MDKSSMHCISVLVILNPMKTHLFTTEGLSGEWNVLYPFKCALCSKYF